MLHFVLHDAEGRIRQQGNAYDADEAEMQARDGLRVLILDGPLESFGDHYVTDGALRPRPPMPATIDRTAIAADGNEVAQISGLPLGALVTVSGPGGEQQITVDDGELSLSADVAATYRLAVECWPFRPCHFEVLTS